MIARRRAHILAFLGLALAGMNLTCADGTGPVADRVEITGAAVMHPGYVFQFSAHAFDAQGRQLPDSAANWASSDLAIATVGTNGLVHALAVGDVTIGATIQDKRAEALLQVTPAPVATVRVNPTIDSMFIGDSILLAAETRDSGGHSLTGRAVSWAVSDSVKATLRQSGWVMANTAGGFAVTASSEGVLGGAFLMGQYPVASLALPDSLTITRYDTVRLIPDVRSATGTRLSGRATTWSTPDTSVLSILLPTGLFTPKNLGLGRVIAWSFGFADTTTVVVVPEPAAGIRVTTYGFASLDLGDSLRAVAEAWDSAGRRVVGGPLSWSSSDTGVVRLDVSSSDPSNVYVVATGPGRAAVSATVGAQTAVFDVEAHLPIVRLVLHPDSVAIRVGSYGQVTSEFVDSLGYVVRDAPAYFRSSDTTIVTVAVGGTCYGRRPGRVTITGTAFANGLTGTAIVIVREALELSWYLPNVTISAPTPEGDSVYFHLDSAGVALGTPQDLHIASSDTSIADVTPSFVSAATEAVVVHPIGKRNGIVDVIASNDSLFATVRLTVVEVPIGSLTLAPRQTILVPGDTAVVSLVTAGIDSTPRPYPVTWATSAPAVATVSQSGLIHAIAGGTATITAASGNKGDSTLVIVRSADPPVVDSVRPGLLIAGSGGVVYGANFDADPTQNQITVDGVPAAVTGASATQLTFQLPPPAGFPCSATHLGRVILSSGGRVETTLVPLADAPQRALAIGQALILAAGEDRCNELTQPGEYYIALVNTTPSADAVASLELRGEAATAAASPPVAESPPPAWSGAVQAPLSGSPAPAALDSVRRAMWLHRRVLEESRRLALQAGPPVPLLRAAAPRPQLSVGDSAGNLVRIRVPRIDYPDFCSRYQAITARRAYTGEHVMIFEDISAPFAGTIDPVYAKIGQEFDTSMYPRLVAAFGDPLVLDSLLDRNGRLVMVFTPLVNVFGLGGFVVSCDFYPETVAPSSNTGEIFYGRSPDPVPQGFPLDAATYWRWQMRTVVMHESKHLAAFAQRLSRGAPLEETWLEEGSAVLAEELWARGIYGTTWKDDATYRQTVYCDVRPLYPLCPDRPYAMFNAFAFLYEFASPARKHSPFGWTSNDDVTFYGSAWSLLRWATDQTADENGFLRALVQDPSLTGTANLEAHTGRPIGDLITDWILASLADNLPGLTPERPELSHPSWNTRDVFYGMSQDFPDNFRHQFPFAFFFPASQTFLQPVDIVRGGSAALFDLSTSQARQLLELRASGGGVPDPALRLAILRIK